MTKLYQSPVKSLDNFFAIVGAGFVVSSAERSCTCPNFGQPQGLPLQVDHTVWIYGTGGPLLFIEFDRREARHSCLVT